MTIRTDDIALGSLGQQALRPNAADESGDARDFRGWISVIEIHRARRKSPLAVRARHSPKVVQHARVSTPATTQPFDISGSRHRWTGVGELLRVRNPGAYPMTVRADDVAFLDLGE